MNPSRAFCDPELLAGISSLELRARRIVEGYVSGLQRSPWQGFSVEFAEHREYVPGDDLRHVDWKAYGKTDKIYIKRYEQDTNLICYLALDASESLLYQSPQAPWTKWDCARTIAAALSHLIMRQQDSLGWAIIADELRQVVRPSGSPAQGRQFIDELGRLSAAGPTSLGKLLAQLAERWNRRGVVVVISDLFCDLSELLTGLRRLHYRQHDVIVLQVLDPAELDFPFAEDCVFLDMEGADRLAVDPQLLRTGYLRELELHNRSVRASCREWGCDFLQIRTTDPLDLALAALLNRRVRQTKI
ncbi:MAG: DUF58 domain-containing protein [Pirellulales bacterium]|nr:DUF58 domain-containing protein [Pirellulales bacterium]